MKPQQKPIHQSSLFFNFEDTLNQNHPLYILANKIHWSMFEEAFLPLYSQNKGRPAKPIRLMVGLLMLKHIPRSRHALHGGITPFPPLLCMVV